MVSLRGANRQGHEATRVDTENKALGTEHALIPELEREVKGGDVLFAPTRTRTWQPACSWLGHGHA